MLRAASPTRQKPFPAPVARQARAQRPPDVRTVVARTVSQRLATLCWSCTSVPAPGRTRPVKRSVCPALTRVWLLLREDFACAHTEIDGAAADMRLGPEARTMTCAVAVTL